MDTLLHACITKVSRRRTLHILNDPPLLVETTDKKKVSTLDEAKRYLHHFWGIVSIVVAHMSRPSRVRLKQTTGSYRHKTLDFGSHILQF